MDWLKSFRALKELFNPLQRQKIMLATAENHLLFVAFQNLQANTRLALADYMEHHATTDHKPGYMERLQRMRAFTTSPECPDDPAMSARSAQLYSYYLLMADRLSGVQDVADITLELPTETPEFKEWRRKELGNKPDPTPS